MVLITSNLYIFIRTYTRISRTDTLSDVVTRETKNSYNNVTFPSQTYSLYIMHNEINALHRGR
jgi:hypothetical protein